MLKEAIKKVLQEDTCGGEVQREQRDKGTLNYDRWMKIKMTWKTLYHNQPLEDEDEV